MKNLIILASIALMIGCMEKAAEFPWVNQSLAEAQKSAGDKIIMLDFYTEW